VLAGHEAQLSQYEDVSAARRNFISDAITNIGSGDAFNVYSDFQKTARTPGTISVLD